MHHVRFRTEEKEVAIAAESVSNAWYVNTKGDRITDHICIGHAVSLRMVLVVDVSQGP